MDAKKNEKNESPKLEYKPEKKMYLVFASIFWGLVALMVLLNIFNWLPIQGSKAIIIGLLCGLLGAAFTVLVSITKSGFPPPSSSSDDDH